MPCQFGNWEELEERLFFMADGGTYGHPKISNFAYGHFGLTRENEAFRNQFHIDVVAKMEESLLELWKDSENEGEGKEDALKTSPAMIIHREVEARVVRNLTQSSLLPPRDPKFTGRKKEITQFLSMLAEKGAVAVTGFRGMGGIGKTAIVTEICHLFRESWKVEPVYPDYLQPILVGKSWYTDGILMIRFEPDTTTDILIERLFSQLGLSASTGDLMPVFERFLEIIQDREILIVLDSAEQNIQSFRFFLRRFHKRGFSVIVTSREKIPGIETLDINRMEEEEAHELFRKYLNRNLGAEENRTLGALFVEIGYLPIAIKILACRADSLNKSTLELKKEFNQKKMEVLSFDNYLEEEQKNLNAMVCFSMSYDNLLETQQEVFVKAGIFNFPFDKKTFQELCGEQDISGELDVLIRYSLIQKNLETSRFDLHPLMKEFARIKLESFDFKEEIWGKKQKLYKAMVENKKFREADLAEIFYLIKTEGQERLEDKIRLSFISAFGDYLMDNCLWKKQVEMSQLALKVIGNREELLERQIKHREYLMQTYGRQGKLIACQREIEQILSHKHIIKNRPSWFYAIYLKDWITLQNTSKVNFSTTLKNLRNTIKLNLTGHYNSFIRLLAENYMTYGLLAQGLWCSLVVFGKRFKSHAVFNSIISIGLLGDHARTQESLHTARKWYQLQWEFANRKNHFQGKLAALVDRFYLNVAEGQLSIAEKQLQTITEYTENLDIDSATYFRRQGQLLFAKEDYAGAIENFERLKHPYEKAANLAKTFLRLCQSDQAKEHLDFVYAWNKERKNPKRMSEVYTYLAEYHILREEYEKAMSYLVPALNTQEAMGILRGRQEERIQQMIQAAIPTVTYEQYKEKYIDQRIGLKPDFLIEGLTDSLIAGDGKEMLLIPEGTFFMGRGKVVNLSPNDILNDPDAYTNPQTYRDWANYLYLYPFYMDKYPVSVAEYKLFCESTTIPFPIEITVEDPTIPMTGITLAEAEAYATWAGKQLAIHAEWERAIRGAEGLRYGWGNHWGTQSEQRQNAVQEFAGIVQSFFYQLEAIHKDQTSLTVPDGKEVDTEFLELLNACYWLNQEKKQRHLDGFLSVLSSFKKNRLKRDLKKTKSDLDQLKEGNIRALSNLKRYDSLFFKEPSIHKAYLKLIQSCQYTESPDGVQFPLGYISEWTTSRPSSTSEKVLLKGASALIDKPEEDFKAWKEEEISPESRRLYVGFRCVKPIYSMEDYHKMLKDWEIEQ